MFDGCSVFHHIEGLPTGCNSRGISILFRKMASSTAKSDSLSSIVGIAYNSTILILVAAICCVCIPSAMHSAVTIKVFMMLTLLVYWLASVMPILASTTNGEIE